MIKHLQIDQAANQRTESQRDENKRDHRTAYEQALFPYAVTGLYQSPAAPCPLALSVRLFEFHCIILPVILTIPNQSAGLQNHKTTGASGLAQVSGS